MSFSSTSPLENLVSSAVVYSEFQMRPASADPMEPLWLLEALICGVGTEAS